MGIRPAGTNAMAMVRVMGLAATPFEPTLPDGEAPPPGVPGWTFPKEKHFSHS